MSLASTAHTDAPAKRHGDVDRRKLIIAAAERAFIRFGFHAATMQHVAEEAGMSAGNLYRYFPSKEAIVEGLCALDQAERYAAFEKMARNGNITTAFGVALRESLLALPSGKARIIIEIWAEAGRNPRVGAYTRGLDQEVLSGLERLMEIAKASGAAAKTLDSAFAARVIFTLVAGLFKRLALEPGFDARAEAAMAVGVLHTLFAGALAPASVQEN